MIKPIHDLMKTNKAISQKKMNLKKIFNYNKYQLYYIYNVFLYTKIHIYCTHYMHTKILTKSKLIKYILHKQ